MAQSYFSLVTNTGKIKLAESAAGGDAVTITHFAIGDGGGAETNPTASAETLVNEVWRTPVESVETDPDNPSAVLVKAIIPVNEGGWWMREFGIFDVEGDMIAVAKPVSQYKPTALEGQLEDILYEFQIIIGENADVTLLVDPSVLLASRAWVAARKIPMSQLMRPDFRSVEGFTDDPPANPLQGQTWIIGQAPNGAFEGHVNDLAEWSGNGWSFVTPTPWFHVGLADLTDWRFDHTRDTWVRWRPWRDEIARLPIYPEALTATAKLAFTTTPAQIVVNSAQSWRWRGWREVSSDDLPLAERTFATVANKTYHLRWHAPGTGIAVPEATWPNGRFELADLTGFAPDETHVSHDTTYDRMLVARVVTSATNVLTVTPLANYSRYQTTITNTGLLDPSEGNGSKRETTIAYNLARTPMLSLAVSLIWTSAAGGAFSGADAHDHDLELRPLSMSRYSATILAARDYGTNFNFYAHVSV